MFPSGFTQLNCSTPLEPVALGFHRCHEFNDISYKFSNGFVFGDKVLASVAAFVKVLYRACG
jgi:hypothetical protein